jgi:hypothetical protein
VDTLDHVLAAWVLPADCPEREEAKTLLEEALGTFGWLRKLWSMEAIAGRISENASARFGPSWRSKS